MNETVDAPAPHETNRNDWATERLVRRWRSIVAVAALGGLAACLYTSYRPAEYTGHVSIFFPSKPSILGDKSLIETGSASAALTGTGPSPMRAYEAFLSSQTAIRAISKENSLKREQFVAKRAIDSDPRASVLSIAFVDRDRARNLSVLRSHVRELASINRKVSFNTASDDSTVLRKRLRGAEAQLRKSEDELVNYQRSLVSAPSINSQMGGGITATPEGWAADLVRLRLDQSRIEKSLASSKERVRMLATLPRDIPTELPPVKRMTPALQDAEYQLAVKRLTLGPESPQIATLEKSIGAMKKQMEEEIRTYLQGVNGGIIDPSVTEGSLPQLLAQRTAVAAQIEVVSRLAKVAPAEAVRLNRRYRQIALQTTVVQQLTSQVLQVGLQAQRDPNRWVVLDDPWIEEKPSNKSYLRMGLSGVLIGVVLGCLFALIRRVPTP